MPTTFVRRELLLACTLFTFAATMRAQTANCTFQPIPLPSKIIRFTPNGINDYSNVVGTADSKTGTEHRAFIRYSDGTFNTFAFDGNPQTAFTRRNRLGVTVGYYESPDLNYHGMVYKNGVATKLDYPGASDTYLTGINASGTIVGYYFTSAGKLHGFQYAKGKFSPVEFPGNPISVPEAINDNGAITGYFENATGTHGFVRQNGAYRSFDDPKSTGNTFAIDINNSGVVVGYYSAPGTVGGAFWYKDGAFKDITMPNAASSYAFGINSQQQVTGYAYVKGQKTPVRYIANCK